MKTLKEKILKNTDKNLCILCESHEEAVELLKILDREGRTWENGTSYLKEDYWNDYRNHTCYYINKGLYGDVAVALYVEHPVYNFKDCVVDNTTPTEKRQTLKTIQYDFDEAEIEVQIIQKYAKVAFGVGDDCKTGTLYTYELNGDLEVGDIALVEAPRGLALVTVMEITTEQPTGFPLDRLKAIKGKVILY